MRQRQQAADDSLTSPPDHASHAAATDAANAVAPAAELGGGSSSSSAPTRSEETERRRGREMSDRGRRILLSTPFKLFTLFIVSVVPVFGTFVALPRVLQARGYETMLAWFAHIVFASWISVQFIYNFGMSQFTDPGGNAHIKPQYELTGQFEMVLEGDGEARELIHYAPNFCGHCKLWKPPRTHHCSFCRRCVLRMDHHCPFTGNCIGFRNHGHFMLMYIFGMVGIIYSFGLCMLVIYGSSSTK